MRTDRWSEWLARHRMRAFGGHLRASHRSPRRKCAMEIRRYKLGEEAAVWTVYFAATRESVGRDYHPDLIERWAPQEQDMKAWGERLAQKNPFIAIVDGQIVGMAE